MAVTAPTKIKPSDRSVPDFVGPDPLVLWVWRRFRRPVWAALSIMLVNAIFYIGFGLYYSLRLPIAKVVPIWETGELLNGVTVFFIGSPAIIAYNLWLPQVLDFIINSLESQGVIVKPEADAFPRPSSTTSLRRILRAQLQQPHWSWIALAIAAIATGFLVFLIVPTETQLLQRTNFWYARPAGYISFCVFYFTMWYFLGLFVARTLAAVLGVRQYFSQPGAIIVVHPFTPDNAGGLGAVGLLSLGLGSLAVILGWLSAIYTAHTALSGGPYNVTVAVILSLLFLAVTPVFLLLPIWSVHRAMVAHRNQRLQQISFEASNLLAIVSPPGPDIVPHDAEPVQRATELDTVLQRLNKLREAHDFVKQNIPVWPIGDLAIRRFSFAATGPLLFTILSIVLDAYRTFQSKP
jgi:hypothetical protein